MLSLGVITHSGAITPRYLKIGKQIILKEILNIFQNLDGILCHTHLKTGNNISKILIFKNIVRILRKSVF